MLKIFTSVKIQRLRAGLNQPTCVPETSMLTTRPPKPSCCRNLAATFVAIHEQPFTLPHIVETVTSQVILRLPKISSFTCAAFQPSLMYLAERWHHHHLHGCPTISEISAPLPVMSYSNYIFTIRIHRLAVKFRAVDHKTKSHCELSIVFTIAHQLISQNTI